MGLTVWGSGLRKGEEAERREIGGREEESMSGEG